jgi:isocitrate/isopropylmalate dehydrogenase
LNFPSFVAPFVGLECARRDDAGRRPGRPARQVCHPFGSAGDPDIPDRITLWGLRLKIRQGFDQYANVRPTRIVPGIDSPLKRCSPEDTFWSVVMLLEHLGENEAAQQVMQAIESVTSNSALHTRDLERTATTADVTRAVCDFLSARRERAAA